MRIEIKPVGELSGGERVALAALSVAVYPPDAAAAWPGRHLEWAGPQWSVVAWADDGRRATSGRWPATPPSTAGRCGWAGSAG